MDALDCREEISFCEKWASEIELDKVSDDDAASITYYAAGYIGRCISRQRKYISCKELLTDTEYIPGSESKKPSCGISKSCGLAAPKQYCRCYFCVLIDNKLAVYESAQQQFFCLKNQIAAFVAMLKSTLLKKILSSSF